MDILGAIGWRTEVDNSGLAPGIARLEAEVRGAMDSLEREDATLKIKGDISQLERKIVEAKADLASLQDKQIDNAKKLEAVDSKTSKARIAGLKGEATKLANNIELERNRLRLMNAEQGKNTYALKQTRDQNAALSEREKVFDRLSRASEKLRAAEAKRDAEVTKAHSAALRMENQMQAARRKAAMEMERQHRRALKMDDDLSISTIKQAAEVEKLRSEYQKLSATRNRLTSGRKKYSMFRDDFDEQQIRHAAASLDLLRDRIHRLGGSTTELDDDVERNSGTLAKWANGLAGVRLNLGFASLKASQFAKALLLLGPIVTGLLGTLSALSGSILEGLTGALLSGGAVASGFALGILGIVGAVSGAKKRLKELGTAAKDMLEDFRGRTGDARDSFFETMTATLDRGRKLLPQFAVGTNKVAAGLKSAGFQFGRAFDTAEMQRFIRSMMGMTANILPNLGKTAGNVGAELADAFRFTVPWIESGADSLGDWSSHLQATRGGVNRLMESLKSVGRFTGAAGGTLWTFFTSGAREGNSLLDDMTNKLHEWTATMKTASGQKSLSEFFTSSVDTAKRLWSMLSNIGQVLFNLADAGRPLMDAIVEVTGAAAKLANVVAGIPGLDKILFGAVALKGASMLGGMLTGIPLVGGALAGLGLKAKSAAGGLLGLAKPAAAVESAAMGMGAPLVAAEAGIVGAGSAAGKSAGLLARMGGAIGPLGLALGVGVAGLTAYTMISAKSAKEARRWRNTVRTLGPAVKDLNSPTNNLTDSLNREAHSIRGAQRAQDALAPAIQKVKEATKAATRAHEDADAAEKAHGRNSLQYAIAQDKARAADEKHTTALDKQKDTIEQVRTKYRAAVNTAQEDVRSLKKLNKQSGVDPRAMIGGGGKGGGGALQQASILQAKYAESGEDLARAQHALILVEQQRALGLVNVRRQLAGTNQISASAAKSVGKFAQSFKKVPAVQKFLVNTNSQQAVKQVSQVGNKLSSLGQKDAVVKIMANADSANEAFRMLSRKLDTVQNRKVVNVVAKGTDNVINGLKKIASYKLDKKDQDVDLKGLDGVLGGLKKVQGYHFTAKSVSVGLHDAASGGLQAIRAGIDSLHDKTVTMTVTHVTNNVVRGAMKAKGGLAGGYPAYASGTDFTMPAGAPTAQGRQGGMHNKPTYIVGEEKRPEFVIATNPAYRQDNIRYLRQAAAALGVGMPGYKKGKGPKATKPYRIGAIPEESGRAKYDKARAQQQSAEQKVNDLKRQIKQLRHENTPKGKDGKKQRKNIADRIDHLENQLHGGKNSAEHRLKVENKQFKQVSANWKALKKVNASIALAQQHIDTDASQMAQAAAEGNLSGFRNKRGDLVNDIDGILGILNRAEHGADGKFKFELQQRIADLLAQKAQAKREQAGADATLTGAQADQLSQLTANQAVAATTEDTADDDSAKAALVSFWERILSGLQASGAGPDAITEAATQLVSARGDSSSSSSGSSMGEQLVGFNSARYDAMQTYGGNFQDYGVAFGGAPASTLSSPASLPAGASEAAASGASGGVSVVNHFANVPEDPHTWSRGIEHELRAIG